MFIDLKTLEMNGIEYTTDLSPLSAPVVLNGKKVKNRLAIQPMEGCDGTPAGAPGELTLRRYRRFAAGGAGLIWAEAISTVNEGRANPRQLMLKEDNIDDFRQITDAVHEKGAVIIAQLTHSGRWSRPVDRNAPIRATFNRKLDAKQELSDDYPIADDEYLRSLPERFARSTALAMKAGFDGVDVKACHLYLYSELLGAFERGGNYGGSYENRVRLLKDSVEAARSEINGGILASRLNMYDGEAGPWGVGENGEPDYTEPLKLITELEDMGVSLFNITMGTPYYNPHVNRPYNKGAYEPDEAPIKGVRRLLEGAALAQKAVKDAKVLATGFSYLKHVSANAAAAMISGGKAAFAGFGRMAFAYPEFANDIIERGKMSEGKCCVTCSLCTTIMRAGGYVGCPVRDKDGYLDELKKVMK